MSERVVAQQKKTVPPVASSSSNLAQPGIDQSQTPPPIVHEVLRSAGRPLDDETRASLEPRFGHDFSKVRVHSDMRAAESAQAVNALAYTSSNNIVFGQGQYRPGTAKGRKLLSHELTHVLQQMHAVAGTESDLERRAELQENQTSRFYPDTEVRPGHTRLHLQLKSKRIISVEVDLGEQTVTFHVDDGSDIVNQLEWSPLAPGDYQVRWGGGELVVDAEGETLGHLTGKNKEDLTLIKAIKSWVPLKVKGPMTQGTGGAETSPADNQTQAPASVPSAAAQDQADGIPAVTVDDASQIEQLKAKGLIDAAAAKSIQGKIEKKEPLTFEDALTLLDAYNKAVEPGSKDQAQQAQDSWLKWAKFIQDHKGQISGKSGTGEKGMSTAELDALLAKYQEFVGITSTPGAPLGAAELDAEVRKSWNDISESEKKLWTKYLEYLKTNSGAIGSDRKDMHITPDDRFRMALSMSSDYMAEGVRDGYEKLKKDPWFWGGLYASITLYIASIVTPELVSKIPAAWITTRLLMVCTLSEITAFANAWGTLGDETRAAKDFGEIQKAAEHFGKAIGEQQFRVLVTLASILVGDLLPSEPLPPGGGPTGLAPATAMGPSFQSAGANASATGSLIGAGPLPGIFAMSNQGGQGGKTPQDSDFEAADTPKDSPPKTPQGDTPVKTPQGNTPAKASSGSGSATSVRPPVQILDPNDYDFQPFTGGGANPDKFIATNKATGQKYIFKAASSETPLLGQNQGILAGERYRRSVAAQILGKEAGISMPETTVATFSDETKIGSMQEWVGQGKPLDEITDPVVKSNVAGSQMKKDLIVFDYVVARMDAHEGNFIVDYDPVTKQPTQITPIDMELSFPPNDLRYVRPGAEGVGTTSTATPNLQDNLPKTISKGLYDKLVSMQSNEAQLTKQLSSYLTPEEITGFFDRLGYVLNLIQKFKLITIVP